MEGNGITLSIFIHFRGRSRQSTEDSLETPFKSKKRNYNTLTRPVKSSSKILCQPLHFRNLFCTLFVIQGFTPTPTAPACFPSMVLDRALRMHFSLIREFCTLMTMKHSPVAHPMELTFFRLLSMKLGTSWG